MNNTEVKYDEQTNLNGDIYVFWHIFVDHKRAERCVSIINRQYEKIKNSGLLERCSCIYIGYVGNIPFPLPHILNNKIKILVHYKKGYEGVTTTALKRFCDERINDKFAILYIHNRGSTRNPNTPCEDWTLMMEFFCIEKWEKGLFMLNQKLTAGCEMFPHEVRIKENNFGMMTNVSSINQNNSVYHYSGNFWWARSDYIRLLKYPSFENRYVESEDWILYPADRTIDKNYFGVLHRTSKDKYKRGLVHSYMDRYPMEYYINANEIPDKVLDINLFNGEK